MRIEAPRPLKRGLAVVSFCSALAAAPAVAQEAGGHYEFNLPYGAGYGDDTNPFDPSAGYVNGNRVIINGRIMTHAGDGTLAPTLGTLNGLLTGDAAFYGLPDAYTGLTAQAVGNQLNIITHGSYNTVIVDNVQINNGAQNVTLEGSSIAGQNAGGAANELNGELDFQ